MLMPVGCPGWRVFMPEPATELAATFARPCNFCRASIMWVNTAAGQRMPVDAESSLYGNVRLYRDGRKLAGQVIGKPSERRRLQLGGWSLHCHHRLSCPQADRWARGQSKPTRTADTSGSSEGLW